MLPEEFKFLSLGYVSVCSVSCACAYVTTFKGTEAMKLKEQVHEERSEKRLREKKMQLYFN